MIPNPTLVQPPGQGTQLCSVFRLVRSKRCCKINSVHPYNSYASIQTLYSIFGFFKKSIYIYIETSVVVPAFIFHQKYEPNVEENNKDFPPAYLTMEWNHPYTSNFTTKPLGNCSDGSHYKLYTWMLNHSQTTWDKNDVLWEHLGEHIHNLENILGIWCECIGNITPPPPRPFPLAAWNSISKTVCHHFQPGLITPL